MKITSIVLLNLAFILGTGSWAQAKTASAEVVRTAREFVSITPTAVGDLIVLRDTDQSTGDLEGTYDSHCSILLPSTSISLMPWNCFTVFTGTLKGKPIKAVFSMWQSALAGEVRKFEIMQGTDGLIGSGTYTGPRDGVRVSDFNYWYCDNENSRACDARMGY